MLVFFTLTGSNPASVSNSFKASKLLINEPVLEIQEFRERYFGHRLYSVAVKLVYQLCWVFSVGFSYLFDWHRLLDLGVEVNPVLPPGDQGSSQLSGAIQLSSKDAFLSKAEAKTISKINGIFKVVLLFVFTVYSLQLKVQFVYTC